MSTTVSSSAFRVSQTCPGTNRRTRKLIHSQPTSCLVNRSSSPDSGGCKDREDLRNPSRLGVWVLDIFGHSSRSEEHTSELQSHSDLVCRLLLEKKKKKI